MGILILSISIFPLFYRTFFYIQTIRGKPYKVFILSFFVMPVIIQQIQCDYCTVFKFSKVHHCSWRLLVEVFIYVLILFFRYLAELCGIGTTALGISGGAGASFPTVIFCLIFLCLFWVSMLIFFKYVGFYFNYLVLVSLLQSHDPGPPVKALQSFLQILKHFEICQGFQFLK